MSEGGGVQELIVGGLDAEGVEVICPAIQEDWSPKAKAARRKQEEDRTDEF